MAEALAVATARGIAETLRNGGKRADYKKVKQRFMQSALSPAVGEREWNAHKPVRPELCGCAVLWGVCPRTVPWW